MSINQKRQTTILAYLSSHIVLKEDEDDEITHHFLFNIDNSYDFHTMINCICEPLSLSKDTTPKSHIFITTENIIIHVSNLPSPLLPCSDLKPGNYQAIFTLPVTDTTEEFSPSNTSIELLFEFDTKKLIKLLVEVETTNAKFSSQNYTLQLEDKSLEIRISTTIQSVDCYVGKFNGVREKVVNAKGFGSIEISQAYLERLSALNNLLARNFFTSLPIAIINELENLNVSGKKLVMGVLYGKNRVYLQNDMSSFVINLNKPKGSCCHLPFPIPTPFPFTAEILKSLFKLKPLNLSHVDYCVDANKLLIVTPFSKQEFTLPYNMSDFISTCLKNRRSHKKVYENIFHTYYEKVRIIKEINQGYDKNAYYQLVIANGKVRLIAITGMWDKDTEDFYLCNAEGTSKDYQMRLDDVRLIINAIEKHANVIIFTQTFKGDKKVYLEVQNSKHSYTNTLIELKR